MRTTTTFCITPVAFAAPSPLLCGSVRHWLGFLKCVQMAAQQRAAAGAATANINGEDDVKCHGLLQSNLGDVLFQFSRGSTLQKLYGACGSQTLIMKL
jgi:hypothetical protein